MSISTGDPFGQHDTVTTTGVPGVGSDMVDRGPWTPRQGVGTSTPWWLERDVYLLEKQTVVEGGLVMQRVAKRLERLGPFDSLVDATAYKTAMEGK